ncbi:MAG: purine-nucleoside phosphorylase [Bacteroidota bacterium]
MLGKINEAVSYIRHKTDFKPITGIILGSGLNTFAQEIRMEKNLPYESIPNFPVATVQGHHGNLVFGYINDHPVVVMEGRFHYYEGYAMEEVIFPIRVMKLLGASRLFVTNACGGLNPEYEVGDMMVIEDHINLMPNPLIGMHHPEFGERFPDMSDTYNKEMIEQALAVARKENFTLHRGCYIGLTGPTLETPAEYKYLRIIGGDVVGMSTVPEIIAAHQMGMQCFAVSVITDLGVPGKIEKTTHQDVLAAAQKAEPRLAVILKKILT